MKKLPRRSAVDKPPAPRKPANPTSARLQMQDIARMAGVSTATVSRALNHSSLVNAATREKIEALARSHKYSVNVGASNLRLQRNRTVSVVLPLDTVTRQHVSDPFFVSLLGGLGDALMARGYDLLLSRVDADRLDTAGEATASGRAIGVILIGQWRQHAQINELATHLSPIVVWGAQLPQQLYCTIGGDNIAGGTLATEHLLANGCRRIAFFGDITLPELGHRFEGYQRVLGRHNISVAADLIHHTPFVEGSAYKAVEKMTQKKTRFDAIFACSDLLALEAISALRELKLRVPEDIAVVGYDDIVVSRYYHPSLTTIRQPVAAAGEALVDALFKALDGKRPKSVTLPTELIVRESSVKSPPRP